MRLMPPSSFWPLLVCLLVSACDVVNAPVSQDLLGRNVLLSSYSETPKHLDSVASYSNNETPWTYAIYEPPLKYHYLKRPYELVPRTLASMPVTTYFDKAGQVLPADAPGASIARSVMELRVRPGIRYQPHPAFATDDAGRLLYHALTPADLDGKRAPGDFPKTGTRELLAADYAYAIRRLATPRIESPAFGFLSEHITGLKAYGERCV